MVSWFHLVIGISRYFPIGLPEGGQLVLLFMESQPAKPKLKSQIFFSSASCGRWLEA
jgi:hypothetical protein